MKFLGTSAGEGVPNPFCSCKVCENARRVGGKEIRYRSSFMLDESVFIDFGADFFAQAVNHGINLDKAECVLFTHMHHDHIDYSVFWERLVKHEGRREPLKAYLSEDAYSYVADFLRTSPLTQRGEHVKPDNVEFYPLKFGECASVGAYKVTPLRGNHGTEFEKSSANYLIEKDGISLYYAVDSGYFIDETFDSLKGKALDIFIGECTFPVTEKLVSESDGHMDISMLLKNLDRLYDGGVIDSKTRVYITHISGRGLNHSELTEYMNNLAKPYRVMVAYDGMEI